MATEQKKHAQDPEAAIESALGRTEKFFQRNAKALVTALVVIVAVVGCFFAYKYLYAGPRAERAAELMFVAEQQFAVDSFSLALHGDGNNAGFLEVAERYGSTPSGNMARHYAGICYLRLGDGDAALEWLAKYRKVDGAPAAIVNAQNEGLRGDVMVQRGEFDQAARYYEQAVAEASNVLTTPYYLKKLGLVRSRMGDHAAALAAYRHIADEWGASMEARDIQKYIGYEEQQQ